MAFDVDPNMAWACLTVVALIGILVAVRVRSARARPILANPAAIVGLTGRMISVGRDPRARLANGVSVSVLPAPGAAPLRADARIVVTGVERGRALVVAAPEHPEGPHATS